MVISICFSCEQSEANNLSSIYILDLFKRNRNKNQSISN